MKNNESIENDIDKKKQDQTVKKVESRGLAKSVRT